MPETEWLKTLRELGSFGLVIWFVWWTFRHSIPKERERFIEELDAKRREFTDCLAQQRQDYLRTAAEMQDRFWAQFEAERSAHEREQQAQRDANDRVHERLAKSVNSLSEVVIYQGRDRRRGDGLEDAQGSQRRRSSDAV